MNRLTALVQGGFAALALLGAAAVLGAALRVFCAVSGVC